MGALCNFISYLNYSAPISFSFGLYPFSLSIEIYLYVCHSKQLYSGSYTVRIASLQGNHGYFSQNHKEKQKQDTMKLENI